jgi:hypothetical protein
MYPSGGNPNYQYSNQGGYGAPSKSPPPLQHPVPQHPIPDFGTAVHQSTTPSPGQQYQQQYNPQQQQQPMMQPQQQQKMHQAYDPNAYTPQPQQQHPNANVYSQFGFNDPAAQMGMQFAGSAMAQGSAYVEKNVNKV